MPATRSIARRIRDLARRVAVCGAAAIALTAQSPAPSAPPGQLQSILQAHLAALRALGVTVPPRTLQTDGIVEGLGLQGTFHYWRDGSSERDDEILGVRVERTLRIGDRQFVQNENGDVREIHGLLARRQITEDFIDSGDFARHPEDVVLLGRGRTADGRDVWKLRVTPPGGTPYGVGIDVKTSMVDEKAYPDGDAIATVEYDRYHAIGGALVPYYELDTTGDHQYDISTLVEHVRVGEPIDPSVFAPLVSATIDAPAPVEVPLLQWQGHLFVRATAGGKATTWLIDTGSQGIFMDPGGAKRLGLTPQGTLEVRGARRTQGLGVAALDAIDIGGARFPVHVVSIVDLSSITYEGKTVDGVLGYPFFAASEVRIDPERHTVLLARPGTLAPVGDAIPVDTDRELPEIDATIDKVAARVVVDTGDSGELLVFHAFAKAHPGVAPIRVQRFASNRGVGGSSAAVPVMVDELQLGPFKLYNRYADLMLDSQGAFADSDLAGNVGWGSLQNFLVTFDLADRSISLQKTRWFDEGRGRSGNP